jgi:hypothetical protein
MRPQPCQVHGKRRRLPAGIESPRRAKQDSGQNDLARCTGLTQLGSDPGDFGRGAPFPGLSHRRDVVRGENGLAVEPGVRLFLDARGAMRD